MVIKRLQLLAYLILTHLCIIYQLTYLILYLLPILFIYFFKPFNYNSTKIIFGLKLATFLLLLFLSTISILYKSIILLFFPPILITLFILLPFALSLRPGYIPLITQIYYLTDGKDVSSRQPKQINYTRTLTWIWFSAILGMLCEIIILSIMASLETWSLYVNFINYFILFFLMTFEWLYRQWYFQRWSFQQWQSPLLFTQQMISIDFSQLIQKYKSDGIN